MNYFRKTAAAILALVVMLSSASCGLKMRDTYKKHDDKTVNDNSGVTAELSIAERKNSVDIGNGEDELPKNEINGIEPDDITNSVTLVITGDIKLSEQMIEDARRQAPEGKEYSFLRMYTGVYRAVNDADVAVGAYSTIGQPYGTEAEYEPPVEHLDALASVGFDVLDISGMGSDYTLLNEKKIEGISSAEEGDGAIRTVEKSGLTFAFIAVGSGDDAQSVDSEDFYKTVEYAEFISDILVVLVHWDENGTADYRSEIIKKITDSGADVIVGDGESVEGVRWVDADDGTATLVVESLGNLLSDADEACNLCSGVLSMTVAASDSVLEIKEPVIIPAFVHYTEENGIRGDYSIYKVEDYTSDVAQSHAAEVDPDGLKGYVKETIPSEFLPQSMR